MIINMNTNFKSARDIMSDKLVFIEGLDTVQDAVDKMKAESVDMLIVNKRNQEDAFGIITVKDIIKKVYINDLKPMEVNIYEIMSKPVITVPAPLNVRYIPRLMLRARIHVAPVEQNGEYIGMISFSSLLHQGLQ
jgi:signal-transduction protein with cAMP-binding, CBS, and nucleotidyltransferase domain